jgi:hypothetical protein
MYTKNHDPWLTAHVITPAILDNFETQYTEVSAYITTHQHVSDYYTKSTMDTDFWGTHNDGPGSGSDADLIYKSTGNMHAADFAGLGIPTGFIINWPEATAPSGWHLCDGAAGTVDMRDKFVLCAGGDYNVGDEGTGIHAPQGSITIAGHSLTVAEVLGHQHTYVDKYGDTGAGAGFYQEGTGVWHANATGATTRTTGNSNVGKATADAHNHTAVFTGGNFTILPPYYSLTYIQKTA